MQLSEVAAVVQMMTFGGGRAQPVIVGQAEALSSFIAICEFYMLVHLAGPPAARSSNLVEMVS